MSGMGGMENRKRKKRGGNKEGRNEILPIGVDEMDCMGRFALAAVGTHVVGDVTIRFRGTEGCAYHVCRLPLREDPAASSS